MSWSLCCGDSCEEGKITIPAPGGNLLLLPMSRAARGLGRQARMAAGCDGDPVVKGATHKAQHLLILIHHVVQKTAHHRASFQFLTLSLLPSPATVCPGNTVSSAFGWGLSHKKKKAMYEQTTGYDPTAGSLPENGNRPGPYSATRLAAGPATLQPCLPGWREHPGLACPGRSRPL